MKHSSIIPGVLSVQLVLLALPAAGFAQSYSHESWQSVLQKFVDPAGLVDYASLSGDREELDRYVDLVAKVSPATHPQLFTSRDHELAYYINAYNALVFAGVLNLGPDATTVWGKTQIGYGFFVKQKVTVGGKRMSLRALENKIIRDEYQDPRIHAALNCASAGCPRLPQDAFDGERLDEQLDSAMTEFVGDERHCRVDPSTNTVYLSKIFDWFRSDFTDYEAQQGNARGGLIDYVNRYRGPDDQIDGDFAVKFSPYDKGLNRQ